MKLIQGDVVLRKVETDLTKATKLKHLILAEGETTGHKHEVECPEGVEAELLALGDRVLLRVMGGDARVVHAEHAPVTVPPGVWEIDRVREYDYNADEARRVMD